MKNISNKLTVLRKLFFTLSFLDVLWYDISVFERMVARLIMNLALIQDGYLPVIVPPILRGDYVSLLERAYRDDGGFTEFIAEREFESQEEILRLFQIPFPKKGMD